MLRLLFLRLVALALVIGASAAAVDLLAQGWLGGGPDFDSAVKLNRTGR